MKGRNIRRDPEIGYGVDEEGFLYYFSRKPSRLCWWPLRRGRKHFRCEDMVNRMALVDRMESGELSLEEAQEQARYSEQQGGK